LTSPLPSPKSPDPALQPFSHPPPPSTHNQALANTYAFAYYAFAPTTTTAAATTTATANGNGNSSGSESNPLAARLTLFEDKQQRLEQEASVWLFCVMCDV
jgi:hypothetical protein